MAHRLVVLALVGCSTAAADIGSSTDYRCDGIAIAPRTEPASNAIATWRALANDNNVDEGWLARVEVAAAERELPAGVADRVRLQHEMLRVAQRLVRIAQPDTLHAVMERIRAVAATSDQLGALGASSRPDVASILGDDITERATATCAAGRLKHVREHKGLLAFRPLRAGATHALVAQLVAYDTNGEPHITPLVDGMELRLGDETSSPACVVRAGDDGVLRAMALDALEEDAPFIVRSGAGVGCTSCHRTARAIRARDITSADEIAAIDRARNAQVETLARDTWVMLAR